MTDDIQARAAAIIHNESDLYLREAVRVAAALAEAGVLVQDGLTRQGIETYVEALNAARAELATVREEWAKTENALYAAHAELAKVKAERDKYLIAYSEMFEQRDEYLAECKRLWPIEEQVADADRRGAERGWDEGYTKGTSAVWFDETVNPYRLTEGDD